MKQYKTISGYIRHLKKIKDHPIETLKDFDKYAEDEIYAIIEIKAFIDNMFGEELEKFNT